MSQKDAKSAKTEIKGSNKQGKSDKISSKLSKADLKYKIEKNVDITKGLCGEI